MSLPILLAAATLGVTHGIEPDHAAGISALTGDADGPLEGALVGAVFAVGHVIVVVGWVAVLTVLGAGAGAAPAVLGRVGSLSAGTVLAGVAVLLAAAGSRRLRGLVAVPSPATATGPVERTLATAHRTLHGHSHDGDRAHGGAGGRARGHGHGGSDDGDDDAQSGDVSAPGLARTGAVGSLFALSPPVSMLVFVSAALPTAGPGGAVVGVAAYAVAITATLAVVGSGVGSVAAVADAGGRRLRAAFELGAAGVAFAVALSLFGVVSLPV
ncbi:MAG: hypothetical protein ABEJ79_08635 [Halolamina sp.]